MEEAYEVIRKLADGGDRASQLSVGITDLANQFYDSPAMRASLHGLACLYFGGPAGEELLEKAAMEISSLTNIMVE